MSSQCWRRALAALAASVLMPLAVFPQSTNVGTSLPAGLVLPPGVQLPPGVALPPGVELPAALRQSTNATAKTNPPASPEEKRLQELLKLQYDRRPPALLEAYAKEAAGNPDATNEVLRFQADVVSGNWAEVKKFLAGLPEKQRPQVYKSMLDALDKTPASSPGQGPPEMAQQGNRPPPQTPILFPDDVLALADACPGTLTDDQVEALGKLLSRALTRGNFIDPFLAKLEAGTESLGGNDPTNRQVAVKLLVAANRLTDAGKFLPPLEPALATNDLKTIDLHARYLLSVGKQKQDTNAMEMLRKTWDLTQTLLAATNCAGKEREQALNRAIELMPLLSRENGTNWLLQTFQLKPEQGMAILAAIGSQVSQGAANRDIEVRRKNLELQRRVVDALLAVVGPLTSKWQPALNVLAVGWMQEGELSKNRYVQRRQNFPQFDPYGNQVFYDGGYYPGMNQDPNQLPPIPIDQLMLTAPNDDWLALLDPSLLPRLRILLAELQLKAEDERSALPYLKLVAAEQPKAALALANEVLRTWARTHDPNPQTQMNRYGPYGPIYYGPGSPYGMNPAGAPLTRAMQARNLVELAALLDQLKQLPIGPLDQKAVVGAFSSAHSRAEVFRVEDIEKVFGAIDQMRGETLAELLQTMRERLANQWRAPRVQQDAKTKRNDKEIEAEVTRGYELVLDLISQGLAKMPADWRMNLVHGAALFDWAEFDYGKKVDLAIYVEKRDRAFQSFEKAASLYGAGVVALEEKDQTPLAFQQWFNACLGASDLAYITRQTEPNTNHLDKIRVALFGLPSEVVERHIAAFGKGLTDSINTLKPELKPRYLRSGIRIVGDHESAIEARKLAMYYDDLLQEIALDVRVDGEAVVGHTKPFGVFVALRHSEALGRESGGFGKYLQNPNSGYYYNPYGRAPVNYREDFEKQVREKFSDSFEVLSVMFHEDKVQPRGYGRPQWRETPYAYLLLKAKDGSVDRIPPLQLDLDFFDKRGQVILPVASQVQLIDARPASVSPRPVARIEVLQVLDDRDFTKGTVGLEIKASGRGLLPELKDLLDLRIPGFRVDKTDDRGLSVVKMDAEGDSVAPISERNWMLTLVADQAASPSIAFTFPKAALADTTVSYKRYSDADLVEVKPELALAGVVLKPTSIWVWVGIGAACLAVVLGLIWWLRRDGPGAPAELAAAYSLPSHITPFTVLNLLQRMQSDSRLGFNPEQRRELGEAIAGLQQYFFSRPAADHNGQPDLEQVARRWVGCAR